MVFYLAVYTGRNCTTGMRGLNHFLVFLQILYLQFCSTCSLAAFLNNEWKYTFFKFLER